MVKHTTLKAENKKQNQWNIILADSGSSLGLDRSGKAQTPELLESLEQKPLLVAESPHLK